MECVMAIEKWMSCNFLLQNSEKKEVILFDPDHLPGNLQPFICPLQSNILSPQPETLLSH